MPIKGIKIARFCIGIDIYDNETKQDIVNEGINVNSKYEAISLLEEVIKKLNNI